mgnify:FL=1
MSDPTEPVQTLCLGDRLAAADGHRIWWCDGGDPRGLPVLVVHGGPGGSSRVEPTRWFEGLPVRWICFDQRGCGRSTPLGSTRAQTLSGLLNDMERLRRQLGVDAWALAGGSWGARLALRYAAGFPGRTRGLMLRSPFLGTLAETRRYIAPWNSWLGDTGRRWLGDAAAAALQALYQEPAVMSPDDTVMTAPDPLADPRVAQAWSAYDDVQSAPGGVAGDTGRRCDPTRLAPAQEAQQASWAVHRHHARRGWGEADGHPRGGTLPHDAGPVTLVWGDADATCDPAVARTLAAGCPAADAREVAGAGHRMGDARLAPVLAAAARDWVSRLRAG